MGKSNSKELNREQLLKIYLNYHLPNLKHRTLEKSSKYVPLDLDSSEKLCCCIPKNRQYKWRKFFRKQCSKLSRTYEWASILLIELKNYKSKQDKEYQLDMKWLKISLYDQILRISRKITKQKSNKVYGSINRIDEEQKMEEPLISKNKNSLEGNIEIDEIKEDNNNNKINKSPSSKNEYITEMIKNSMVLDDKEILACKTNSFTFLPDEPINNKDTQNNLTNYYHNTFINSLNMKENTEINEKEDSSINDLLRAVTHYKILCETIEKHLNDKNNVLCNLKQKYIDYFISKYDEIIKNKEISFLNENLYSELIEASFEDLKQFIRIFHQSIYYFYKINYLDNKIMIQKSFFKPENIHNFLTSILLDIKMYSILYLSLVQLKEKEEDYLRQAMEYCNKYTPKEFGINQKFWLDEPIIDNENKVLENYILEELGNSNVINQEKSSIPYEKAINSLKEIEFVRSPLHKLKIIVKTGDLIIQCIEEFYKKFGMTYSRNSISADDLLPIFIYVVAKSKVKCFYAHCKIIEELSSENLKKTISGYYFVTLQLSLKIIEGMFKDKDKDKEKDNNNNVSAKSSFSENLNQILSETKNPRNRKSNFFSVWRN